MVPGPHGFDHGSSVLPFLRSTFLLLLLLAALAAVCLWRTGSLPRAQRTRRDAPEEEAKRILAERFARGDLA